MRVRPLAFYERLAALAREHDFVLASDEAYTELWFAEPPVSALQLDDLTNVAVFNTLSKRSSMTGYRSGFVAGDPELVAALRHFRPTIGTAPQEFVQRASIVAWGDEEHVERARAPRTPASESSLLGVLERKGVRVACSEATMYLWVAVAGRRGVGELRRAASRARCPRCAGIVSRPVRRGLRPLRARPDRGGVRARRCDPGGCALMDLPRRIDELFEAGEPEAAPVEEAIRLLDAGEVRVAEPRDGGWVVNEWAKKAILLYFKLRKVEPMDAGAIHYLDKIPLKNDYAESGVRVVPGGVARYGAFLSPGVILMPGFVNIGAWVGPRTMVDTWATVGSCAQIGADVHLAGGVGIGGVLEPPQAQPVIVEDGAFIGSRVHRHRGRPHRRRAPCSLQTSR